MEDLGDAEPPFDHGVASGDPLPDRVLLWTKLTATKQTEVRWEIGLDPKLKDVVQSGNVLASPRKRCIVTVDATGLRPGTTYYYRFDAMGTSSPVGRTRTAPADGCTHLKFAVASCAKYVAGYFNAYGRIAEQDDLDFVLHLGDYSYQMGADERDPGGAIGRSLNSGASVTPHDYQDRYSLYRQDIDLQHLHQMHPVIGMLDDNDICNGTWRDGAEKHDPATEGPWSARKSAAIRAWRDWVPSRARGPSRLFRKLQFGGLADLVILDERTHRDEMTKGHEIHRPGRTILGETQLDWLLRELTRSRATWRLVANPVMIGQCHSEFFPQEVGHPLGELGVLTKQEYGPDPDQWDGYTDERQRIFAVIRERAIRDVVFLSGDVHSAWAIELKHDPDDEDESPVAVEFVTTSVTSQNLDERMKTEPRTDSLEIERIVDETQKHVRWLELDSHGYVLMDVDPDRMVAEWRFVGKVTEPNNVERIGAAWAVPRGQAQLEKYADM